MKSIIFICCVVFSTVFYSCFKCTYYYAFCDKGHSYWKSSEYETCSGEMADSRKQDAHRAANDHDYSVHGGVQTATVTSR